MAEELSAVAGIVDMYGGFRVVVTQRWRMAGHVSKELKERLFVVPGLKVKEPVPWEEIPWVIQQAQDYMNKCLAPKNHCQECKACCKTPYLKTEDFEKPSHKWCDNCCSSGCNIYWKRPQGCRLFECSWLKSQSRNDVMPPELRPDRCGVIFTHDTQGGDPLVFEVHPDRDRPNAVNGPHVQQYIEAMKAAGYKPKLITYYVGEGS